MATNDFVEDAVDTLMRDPSRRFLMVVGEPGSTITSVYSNARSREGFAYLLNRVNQHGEKILRDPRPWEDQPPKT